MCGLVGAYSFGNAQISADYLIKLRDTLAHRGPDGAGIWIHPNGHIGLAHRRLAIIDLSTAAQQPMHHQQFSLVFNGEIYNHAEIRQELIQLGHTTWQTDHSDTEVLLQAFAAWGIDCVHKFRGMFAFAIWDEQKQELWLARDRIGIKPLYYSLHHQRLVFASEIKALLQDPLQPRAVNEESLFHYLSFLVSPAPETLFAGIQKLAPGTWLKINSHGELKLQQYWDVWDHVNPLTNHNEDQIAELVLSELTQAVNLRKVADVNAGVFLSGGIDSSTNAALFAKNENLPVRTFSIGYEGEYASYQNELGFAQQMADFIQADHHQKLLSVDDLLNFLPQMIYLQDEPIADPVCVPVYYVSELARQQGIKVAQVGEGADELFWGYPSWKIMRQLQAYSNIPGTKFLKFAGLKILELCGQANSLHYEFLRRGYQQQPIFWSGAESFTEKQKFALLSPRLRHKFRSRSSFETIQPSWQAFQDKAWERSILNWMSYRDLTFRLPELLLMRVDKMSMGVSLEARVPFLDHKLVELAFSIPSKIKTKNNELKYILKKSVKNLIPTEIIQRRKQGFGVPIYEWLFDKLGPVIHQELNAFTSQTDFFDKKEIQQMLADPRDHKIWYLFNLALWWKKFIN